MYTNLITRLGEVAANAASGAIRKADRAGVTVAHVLAPFPWVV